MRSITPHFRFRHVKEAAGFQHFRRKRAILQCKNALHPQRQMPMIRAIERPRNADEVEL